MKPNKNVLKFFFLIFFLVVTISLVRFFGLHAYFEVTSLRTFIESYGLLGPLVFIGLYILATILFLPGTPLTLAAGVLFGTPLGTAYTVIGASIGATLAFLVARYGGRGIVQDLLQKKLVGLKTYDQKIGENGFGVVLFLRLIPLFPFNGLNFALGITRVRLPEYILGTFLGIIPGSFILAYFGASLAEMNVVNIIFSGTLFLLMMLSLPLYNYLKKRGGSSS